MKRVSVDKISLRTKISFVSWENKGFEAVLSLISSTNQPNDVLAYFIVFPRYLPTLQPAFLPEPESRRELIILSRQNFVSFK